MTMCFAKFFGSTLVTMFMMCVCVVSAVAVQQDAKTLELAATKAIEPFPILSFVPPAIEKDQLKLFKEAGFTVLTIRPTPKDYEVMKKYWDGNYILYNIWGDPNLTYDDMIAFHPDDPQLVGYFLGDEPNYVRIDEVGKIADKFRDARPDKPCLVNIFPSYAGYQLGSNFHDYVIKYFEVLKPQYCSLDNYACFWFNVDRTDFYNDIGILRYYAKKYNSRQIGFVQVYSSNVCREVSESDLAWQVNSFLAYGCKGLWYFNYRHPAARSGPNGSGGPVAKNDLLSEVFDFRKSPGVMAKPYKPVRVFGSAVLDMNDHPSYAYSYVKRVNNKVLAWGKILNNLENVSVFHAGSSIEPGYNPHDPVGADIFYPGKMEYIEKVTPDNMESPMGYIISYFTDSAQRPYVMVVNKKHGEDISCEQAAVPTRIAFKDNVCSAYIVSNTDGSEKQLEIKDKTVIEKIGGGEAILLRLEISSEK